MAAAKLDQFGRAGVPDQVAGGAGNATAEVALITGACSGMGGALADCFAAAGHSLVGVARRAGLLHALAERLRRVHSVSVWVLAAKVFGACLRGGVIVVPGLINRAAKAGGHCCRSGGCGRSRTRCQGG